MNSCEVCGIEAKWHSGFLDGVGNRRPRFLCEVHWEAWFHSNQLSDAKGRGLGLEGRHPNYAGWQLVFDEFVAQTRKEEATP